MEGHILLPFRAKDSEQKIVMKGVKRKTIRSLGQRAWFRKNFLKLPLL